MKLSIALISFVLVLVTLVESRPVREINLCIASYLKSNGYQIEGSGTETELNPLCTVIVEVVKSQILSNFKREIDQNDAKVSSECIINAMNRQGFADEALMLVIVEEMSIDEEKKNALKMSTQKKVADFVFNSYITCDGEKKFSEEFEKLFDDDTTSASDEKPDEQEDYCQRHHIIKQGLIKVKGVKLIENPNKLDTTAIDCQKIYKKSLKEAEDELIEHITGKESNEDDNERQTESSAVTINNDCLLKVIRNENFIDRMIPFDYMRELSLLPEQRHQFKEQFVHTMKQLSLHTRKCIS